MNNGDSTFGNLKYKYRFLFTLDYLLKKIGINFIRAYIYSFRLDDFVFREPETGDIIIKVCDVDDLPLFGELGGRFLSDMQDGHILIGAFLNDDWIGYNWISFKPVEMEEVERVIRFDGGYLWRVHVKEEFRRRGVAKRMVDFSLNQIKNIYNKNRAYTAVETSNVPSIKTFESLKFIKVGFIKYSRLFFWKKYEERMDDVTIIISKI